MTTRILLLSLLSTFLLELVSAHDNGMDMSMDGAMNLASGNMLTYLHFTTGDIVWFQGWVPQKAGSMVGACIGLFLLAVFDRWLSAYRGLMDSYWYRQAKVDLARKKSRPPIGETTRPSESSESSVASAKRLAETGASAAVPTFPADKTRPKNPLAVGAFQTTSWFVRDVPRGIVQAAQSALEFAFMLVVMTYQVGFIISIVVGLGVGEAMFGRYQPRAHLYDY